MRTLLDLLRNAGVETIWMFSGSVYTTFRPVKKCRCWNKCLFSWNIGHKLLDLLRNAGVETDPYASLTHLSLSFRPVKRCRCWNLKFFILLFLLSTFRPVKKCRCWNITPAELSLFGLLLDLLRNAGVETFFLLIVEDFRTLLDLLRNAGVET